MSRLTNNIGRFFTALGSILSLGFLRRAERIERNPEVVGMEYDDIIKEKKTAAVGIKNAVGALIAQQETSNATVERIKDEIEILVEERDGALALAQERMKELRAGGMADADAINDGEVQQYQAAYADAASTIAEKEKRIIDLVGQVESLQGTIDQYTVQAQQLAREVERLGAEKQETQASMLANKELNSINEMLAGIALDGTGERLQRVRQIRAETEGRAKAAARIAGTEQKVQSAKLRAAAKLKVANKDFLAGLGIKAPAESTAAAPSAEKPSQQPVPEQESRSGLPE